MKDTRFIKTIRLRNLLSFGPKSEKIELRPLNVLIGPNASGKSNFIDAINLLHATVRDLGDPIRKGGGIKEWEWKGEKDYNPIEIEIMVFLEYIGQKAPLRYRIAFSNVAENITINEEILDETINDSYEFFYMFKDDKAYLEVNRYKEDLTLEDRIKLVLNPIKDFKLSQSILSQRRDSLSYPILYDIGYKFGEIKIYKNFNVDRIPQQTDLPADFILEDFSNYALILNDLKDRRETKDRLIEKFRLFYNEVDYMSTKIHSGTIQLFVYEKGLKDPIPATRLSDGTLRYLCLLMILCHPEPPPLICIEEPEIGLHPDIMPTIADLLIKASKRTQLIVTTHSDVLVSALSETPESVLVCEHDEAGSHLRRLDEKKLKVWLENYSLGELWLKGEIGGTRW